MPVLIDIIAVIALICLMCYARGLYLELKSTKEKLEEAKDAIKYLENALQEAYKNRK